MQTLLLLAALLSSGEPSSASILKARAVTVHPERPEALVLMADQSVRVLRLEDGDTLGCWSASESPVWTVDYAPCGDAAIIATLNGSVTVRSSRGGALRKTLLPPSEQARNIRRVLISPCGARVLIGSHRGPFSLWSTETWEQIASIPASDTAYTNATWNANGTLIGTVEANGPLSLWDGKDGFPWPLPFENPPLGTDVTFQPGGNLIAMIRTVPMPPAEGGWREVIDVYDLTTGTQKACIETWGSWEYWPAHSIWAQFSPNGKHILGTSGSGFVASWGAISFQHEWLTSPTAGMPFQFPAEWVLDGQAILVSGNFVEDSCLLDARTKVRLIELPNCRANTSAISADERSIIATTESGAIEIYDVPTHKFRLRRSEYESGEVKLTTIQYPDKELEDTPSSK